MFEVDGLSKPCVIQNFKQANLQRGQFQLLQGFKSGNLGKSGKVWGAAVKGAESNEPIFVSIGHKCDLEVAIKIVNQCCIYRIPEPVNL
jgi:deoxyinosine 3'endonuclease (endonuclease V)